MGEEKTAGAVGWAQPTRYAAQLVLFGNDRDALLASAGVSLDDMARWYKHGWISFDAACVEDLDEARHAEMLFVRDIARSGLSDAVVSHLLSELPRPYAYSPERVAYSFHFGWVQMPRPLSIDEMIASHLRDWLEEQITEGNLERLMDILEQLNVAVEDCDGCLRRQMKGDQP